MQTHSLQTNPEQAHITPIVTVPAGWQAAAQAAKAVESGDLERDDSAGYAKKTDV